MPPKHVLAQTLGLPVGDIAALELSSTFPAENRPVILRPVADLSHKNDGADHPKLLCEIERILKKHKRQKGVIHTVSYGLNKLVMSLGDPRLITHENAQDKEDALKRFSSSRNGVFVSPSSARGLDLPDDECRFIVIAKCPFMDLSDKLVSSRLYSPGGLGRFWYKSECAQSIIQASGRGVRHREDWCTTYLLDAQIAKLLAENPGLFPGYWRDALEFGEA
jgi:Rad3-related DNA helicase